METTAWPLLGVVAGLLLVWLALVIGLYLVGRRESDPVRRRDALRLGPDIVRLLHRVASDRTVPRSVHWGLGAVVLYLAAPIDLVPDFIPLVGYADDAVVAALALRWVIRAAGREALDRHWDGSERGLLVVKRLAGVEVRSS